jgi:mannose-6-phosphate isomerase-like protein (cupin superfamily)
MSPIRVVNLAEKFDQIPEYYSPRVAGEINNFQVKLAKLKGEFMWHHHENEDELFLVTSGTLCIKVREESTERELMIRPGEFTIIPRGVEHMPVADEEVHVILLEPNTTLNTGTVVNERTKEKLERI